MRDDEKTLEQLKNKGLQPVTKEEAEDCKNTIKAVHYAECSAKTNQGVQEVFDKAIRTTLSEKTSTEKKECFLL